MRLLDLFVSEILLFVLCIVTLYTILLHLSLSKTPKQIGKHEKVAFFLKSRANYIYNVLIEECGSAPGGD